MSMTAIVSCRFIKKEPEPEPIAITPEQQFASDMMREYWHEAIDAGFTKEEAALYVKQMCDIPD